jgi:hypothetical protein
MKLEILKNLKPENSKRDIFTDTQNSPSIIDYNLTGYIDAGQHLGDRTSLLINLEDIYKKHFRISQSNEVNSKKDKDQRKSQIEFLERENGRLEDEIANIENIHLPDNLEKINSLKEELNEIKISPEKDSSKKEKTVSHLVGIALLIFLSLYLWVFYSSAGYSSFFREIVFNEDSVLNSVFYPKALSEAYQQGFTAILFTVLIPFVFLSLGFLIHKFVEIKQKWAYNIIALLTLITFLFDFILAYEISKKLYDAAAANSFIEKPEYGLANAFTDINVYMIIFAGFVVYIVWGMLFYFVTLSFGSRDVVKTEVNKRTELIEESKNNSSSLRSKITELKRKIDENKKEILNLKNPKRKFIYNYGELDNILTQYVSGWNKYLVGAKRPKTETDQIFQDLNNFLERIQNNIKNSGENSDD